jgi:hypothetical protein
MGLHDHVGVIGTVSDCESDFIKFFDKFDDFGFLGRGDSAEDQRVDSWNDVKQVIFTVYEGQSGAIDDRTCSGGDGKEAVALLLYFFDKSPEFIFRVDEKALINEPAGDGNILSSFELVACEHDPLDSALPQGINSLRHVVLQLILNSSGPQKPQT